jgi:hypothetical protein
VIPDARIDNAVRPKEISEQQWRQRFWIARVSCLVDDKVTVVWYQSPIEYGKYRESTGCTQVLEADEITYAWPHLNADGSIPAAIERALQKYWRLD